MVIFLQFSVSGNAISIVASHKILLTDLFAFISFKKKKTQMARKIVIFQNFEKLSIFKIAYFYRLSKGNQFYYCFILDITCSLVPDIEHVCIWFRLDSMSIYDSIVKHTISFYNYHVFALFPWQPIPVIFLTNILSMQ